MTENALISCPDTVIKEHTFLKIQLRYPSTLVEVQPLDVCFQSAACMSLDQASLTTKHRSQFCFSNNNKTMK